MLEVAGAGYYKAAEEDEMTGPDTSPLQSYAAWYAHQSPSALLTADHFKRLSRSAGRAREAELWYLIEELLREAEESTRYHPEAICGGMGRIAPQRRWFVSQFALIQHLLQRHATLRRMNVICGWLEATRRGAGPQPARLVGQEDGMLRHSIFAFLRAGQVQKAVDAAVTYGDVDYSCLLSAAQLQSVQEPWFAQTALVALFGEYGHSELSQAWCGNEHRLDNLAQLYVRSVQAEPSHAAAAPHTGHDNAGQTTSAAQAGTAQQGMDAVIAAALCGNLAVLEPAFLLAGSWADVMWCYLRCTLVLAFTKALVSAHTETHTTRACDAYVTYVTQMTGTDEDWPERFARRMVTALTLRLQQSYLERVSLVEQLQMRVILQSLSAEGGEWLGDIGSDARSSEAVRLVTHTLLVLDAGYRETLLRHPIQVRAGATLMRHLVGYARALVHDTSSLSSSSLVCEGYGNGVQDGLRLLIPLVQRLRHGPFRANVYAAYLLAARELELLRGVLDKAAMEEQEAALVRLYVEAEQQRRADNSSSESGGGGAGEVEREVQEQLMQAMTGSTRDAEEGMRTCSPPPPPSSSSSPHTVTGEAAELSGAHCNNNNNNKNTMVTYDAAAGGAAPAHTMELLTHNALAERVLWAAMHASSAADYCAVLRQGLEACVTFWSAAPQPLFAAIHDVSGILTRRVLPQLIAHTRSSSTSCVSELEQNEVRFWYAFRELRRLAEEHARLAGELSMARAQMATSGVNYMNSMAGPEKTLLFQLAEDEAAVMQRLREHAVRAVRSGGAVVQRARTCLTAVVYLVQLFVDEATVSVLCAAETTPECAGGSSSHALPSRATTTEAGQEPLMQVVLGLLEELDSSGYLHPRLLPQASAAELFVHIRSLRVAYGQRLHEQRVRQAIQSAAMAAELACDAA